MHLHFKRLLFWRKNTLDKATKHAKHKHEAKELSLAIGVEEAANVFDQSIGAVVIDAIGSAL